MMLEMMLEMALKMILKMISVMSRQIHVLFTDKEVVFVWRTDISR